MTQVHYLIGVDGGGTGCRARIRDARDGGLLGEGAAGPGNVRLGLDQAWSNIVAAIDGALAGAGMDRAAFSKSAVGLGLAGIVDEQGADETISAGPRFARAEAVSDAHTACLGAFGGRDGAILITGTGSAGHAVVNGRGTALFGWGFEVNDKGSAASLGRSAIAAALDDHDGLTSGSPMTHAVFAAIGGSRVAAIDWMSVARPREYGSLAPMVMEFASNGDPVARVLVRRSAGDIETMLARLISLGSERVCLVGGMADHISHWLTPWARSILVDRDADAMEGAILLARQAAANKE
jgi:glucosamine kinase